MSQTPRSASAAVIQEAFQHHQAGRLPQAEAIYQEVLKKEPAHADALHLLGVIALQSGKYEDAVNLINKAITVNSSDPNFHSNCGDAWRAMGRLNEAVDSYQKAIRLKPDFYQAHNNLGNAYQQSGKLTEAFSRYQRAVELNADYPLAHFNLGNIFLEKGASDEAIACYQTALRLNPLFHEVYANLGIALQNTGRLEEATVCYRKAVEQRPDSYEAHNNLGVALKEQGKFNEAIACHEKALELKPDSHQAHGHLVLATNYHPAYTPQAIFDEHLRWAKQHAAPLAKFINPHSNDRNPARHLRVGYVSPDFRRHSVACFFEPLLAMHNRSRFEITCYANNACEDAVTQRLRDLAGQWRSIAGMSDKHAAELIRQDQIDILVDLAGHTGNHRLFLFARKPAPVQVTFLGYPNTTGLSTMDYRISDAHADPPGLTDSFYTEKLLRLPETGWCYQPPADAPNVVDPPVLKSGHITFASFNNLSKVSPEIIRIWSQILLAVPGSVLLMKTRGLGDPGVQQDLRDRFAKYGIPPERLEFLKWEDSLDGHLGAYGRVDIGLDTFPYHGATTTCEAMWMGIPVVTLAGNVHASRVGVSLLTNMKLTDFIARTPDEYVKIVVQLAGDRERLQHLRLGLRDRMKTSPLMDAPHFTQAIEKAYQEMWKTWCVA